MNSDKRATLNAAVMLLNIVQDAEAQDKVDLPDGIEEAEQGQAMLQNVADLETATLMITRVIER